ncbi:phytase [Rubrimonas sp.]|uniref:phytase n=1 Tax=Rubrimonas sp. TaxID=2036015 RepID=UPI002FDE464A
MSASLRVATFNASLNRSAEGALIADLADGTNPQARAVAEIVQRTDADVILINEFDYDEGGEAARLFRENFLAVSQNGVDPVDYPHVYVAPSNTGVQSGLDLNGDGAVGGPDDAFGFGFFPGQFGFAIFSKHPIATDDIRTFQTFLWKDMPGNLLTEDPTENDLEDFYSPEAVAALRLSSKNHVDVPVIVDGETVHVLAAHPTPPVFDGPEDRNGKRNHDEIRFWTDYVAGADYIYDDSGATGGLAPGARFVIVGDYNADPFDGDSFEGAINQLIDDPAIIASATDPAITPSSEGGPDAAIRQGGSNATHQGDPAFDTADFGFNPADPASDLPPANLRVDYVLPSAAGFAYRDGGVFWQAEGEPPFPLAEFPTSDHRLVWADLTLTDANRRTVAPLEVSSAAAFRPLDILLVNDDGFDAEGIAAMRDALLAEGHAVTVVAPLEQQSGKGTSIDADKLFRPLTITEFRPGDFSVDGAPVTTTIAGLDFLLKDSAPDLVISGINEGQNIGHVALSSGTVGAAVTAILRGVPAIAISAGLDFAEAAQGFPSLPETYANAAALVAALVADLSARKGQGLDLIPGGAGLNVNLPSGWDGETVAFTTVAGSDGLSFVFTQETQGEDDVTYAFSFGDPSGAPDSEGVNFAAGAATISVMNGDWSAPEDVRAGLEAKLTDLSFTQASIPTRALDILLTNDDGFDSEGLETLATALRAAGHRVRIAAPLEQQSGQGTNIDAAAIGSVIEVTEFAPGDFAVDSTPVNVTNIALTALLDDAPDLVVSGINEGQNVGLTTISSGTVSAAIAGLLQGVPSIAVSAGLDFSEAAEGFPSTEEAYDIGAIFTADLIADLIAAAGDGPLLPEGVALSVNVPTGEIAGVSFTRLDDVTPLGFTVAELAPGVPGFSITFDEPSDDPLSEGSEFLKGKITVTPLDGNYTAPEPLKSEVEALLEAGDRLGLLLGGAPVESEAFLGFVEIPSFTEFEGAIVGGLSGLTYDPVRGVYLAVSDDRDAGADGAPRVYELAIAIEDGALSEGDVTVLDVTALTLEDGTTLDAIRPDPEGIALGASGRFWVSSERDLNGNPSIWLFDRDGQRIGELPVDAKFLPDAARTQGVRSNLGFESLTITPDGRTLWTATESAIAQDGGLATTETSAVARLIRYDLTTGEAVAEHVYEVEPIANERTPEGAFADSGLVELIALDDQGTLLALERSFSTGAEGRGYSGKLFLVRTQGATNVIDVDAIPSAIADDEREINVDAVAHKELLLDLADLGIVVDNIEGMALGPVLPDGRQALVIISDDNFSGFGPQASQFIALALDLGEVPTIAPLLETPDELRYPGPAPIVIAHRGASGELPEHTLGAYARAIADGADFIEPDLVSTKDGVLIARHEPWLATVQTDANGEIVRDATGAPVVTFASTDVATKPEFADRLASKQIGFSTVTGWFAEDFTLAEIKTLRAVEDQPDLRPNSALYDGLFEIPTLDEVIDLVQAHEDATGEKIGLYPETKEPTYFDAIGLSLEEKLIDTLVAQDFTDPDRVFIQSFEIANLLDLQETVMPAAGLDLPLVQLMFNFPSFPTFDLFLAQQAGDLSAYASIPFITETTVSGDLYTPEGFAALAAAYAEGVGPAFSLIVKADGTETSFVADAHEAGLLVHAYTHRDEGIVPGADGAPLDGAEAYARLLGTGIDGLFTDHPATGRAVTDDLFAGEGPDPDDPAVWRHPTDPAASVVYTAMKEGGLRVYDLAGAELQRLAPEGIRYNNIDVIYDFAFGGAEIDIAIASDRANDTLAIFAIGADGLLTEITSASVPETIFGVDDGEATAYGLAAWTSPFDGETYAYVTQASGAAIAQLRLTTEVDGVSFEKVRDLPLPVADGDDPEDYQSEGIAIDRETGIGYVTVEDELGLLAFDARPDAPATFEIVADIDSGYFAPDLEGVALHYGPEGEGLILVSSQGDATFAVFDRETWDYLGSFAVRGEGGIDGVEESDGLEIYSGALPGFESGLLVTQDGSNEIQVVFGDPEDGEIQNFNVNFKYSNLGDVLALFGAAANPDFDPRALAPRTLPNGVAAGDVTTDSVVLWTRSLAAGDVTFTVSDAEGVVATATATVADPDIPVKVAIDGLAPGADYTYAVADAAGGTGEGRFATAAAPGETAGLHFGVTGDWRGELAPYPAIANAAEKALDFFLLHGDTIYADYPSPAVPLPQAVTLEDFRAKHAEVYGDRGGENFWAALRASTAIAATIDDHEVTNDFAGGGLIGTTAESEFRDLFPGDDGGAFVNDATLYDNGLQAFQEFNPIRDEFYGDTGDARTAGERKLYRAQQFGDDAAMFVLDQRSFRDEQIAGVTDPTDVADIVRFQTESFDPTRTLLGRAQIDDLKADLKAAEEAGVTWKFVYTPEPIQDLGLNNADSWEGYKAERTELLKFIADEGIDNVVFVAADIHATFVNNLTYSETPLGPQIGLAAFEVTTGSVAFNPPFGPAVIGAISGTPLLPPEQEAFYDALPVAPDGDGLLNDKDDFLREAFNALAIDPLGLDRIGLDDNLPQADGLIDATLLEGGWVSAHTLGWTEFEIDAETQALTVTTWGIETYGEADLAEDLAGVLAREPAVVSRFVVEARPLESVIEAGPERETLVGTDRADRFVFGPGDSDWFARDRIVDFEAGDRIDLTAFGFEEIVASGPIDADTLRVRAIGDNTLLFGGEAGAELGLLVEGALADIREGLLI